MIDGKKGIDACNVFKDKYKTLYNQENEGSLYNLLSKTKANITHTCQKCSYNDNSHLHHVTPSMVNGAVKLLKRGKKDDANNIFSDAFIEAPKKLYLYISFLYTIMLHHGLSEEIFNLITFSPLIKNKRKNIADSDNYRAIALNSSLCKIFDYILINYFSKFFESSDYQFAYKKAYSTSLCSFNVMETIQYYRSRGSRVISTLLDCSKAFDGVRFHKLFQILVDRGLCPLVVRLLIIMYSNIEAHIKWNDKYSNKFKINNGVKQGGVLSPLLFTLYIDELISRITLAGVGCYIGKVCSAIFVYADDIILLSPTRRAMQVLLDICEQFGKDFGLTYNPAKCETIIFGDSVNMNLTLCNSNLKIVDKAKHLGLYLHNNRDILSLSSLIADIKTRTNVIMSQFNFLSYDSRMRIFNSNCTSYYGSNLFNLLSLEMVDLDRAWRICSRRILGVHVRTHSRLIPNMMSTLPLSIEILIHMHSFFLNGFHHSSEIISFYFRNCLINRESIMFKNLSYMSLILGINIFNLTSIKKGDIKYKINSLEFFNDKWKIDFIKDILNCLEQTNFNHNFNSSDHENFRNILDYLCISS